MKSNIDELRYAELALLYLWDKYDGHWLHIYNALENKEDVDDESIEYVKEKYKDFNIVTIVNKDYPEEYKQKFIPPFLLFKTDDGYKYKPFDKDECDKKN